jgi:hypothetical protein
MFVLLLVGVSYRRSKLWLIDVVIQSLYVHSDLGVGSGFKRFQFTGNFGGRRIGDNKGLSVGMNKMLR